jgi:signal peptidase I
MTRARLIGLVLTAVSLAVLTVAVVFLAPVQVGGRTAYVITTGSSMEPTFTQGDLVLTRTRGSYEVGDIVLYHSQQLDRDVLHRIVAIDGKRLVVKGDNNGYRDPEHPTVDQIRGAAWVLVPAAGRPLEWLQQPLVLAALAFVVVLLLLAGGRQVSRRGRPGSPARPEPVRVESERPETSLAVPRTVLTGAVAALVLFGLLAVLAFGRPATRTVDREGAWRHAGTFSYRADVPESPVYPDGRLTTGDTIFTNIVRKLRVEFDYSFTSAEPSDIRGGISLDAVVSDGQGWTRTLPIRAEQPLDGADATITGVLDVQAVRAIVARMKELTGSTTSVFTVGIAPTAEVAGYAGAELIDDTYRPELELQLDDVSMRPATGADGATPSYDVQELGVGKEQVGRAIGLGIASLSADRARALALLGLAVSFIVAAAAGALVARHAAGGDAGRIQARYGSRIVVADVEIPDGRWVTDLRSIDELARIADHYDRVILRTTHVGEDAYYVDDGVAVYRYVAGERSTARHTALPVRDG